MSLMFYGRVSEFFDAEGDFPENDGHVHECRDCGAEVAAGEACTPDPIHPEDCDWPGGNAGCGCEDAE